MQRYWLLLYLTWFACHICKLNILVLIIIWLACGKGYTGPTCKIKCPFPSYGVDCQMICNCTDKECNPANGCNNLSTGVHTFLIALYLECHLQLYTNVKIVIYNIF